MTAVSQRLASITDLASPLEETGADTSRWIFTEVLAEKKVDFFRPIIEKHQVLNFEYNVLCTQLAHDFFREKSDKKELEKQLIAALEMAELLAHIYRHYLAVPREVLRLQKEQNIYRELLKAGPKGIQFADMVAYEEKPDWVSQTVRNFIAHSNWARLFLVRSKKVLETIAPLVSHADLYRKFVANLDKFTGPVFSYVAWIFFIPRLSTNLFLLLKHLIPGPWRGDKEKELGFLGQTNAQLQRRWFEVGNDAAWLTAGVLGCFVWLGPLAPVGVYINIALYVYDIVLASVRAGMEISQLKNLQNEYKEKELALIARGVSPEELDEVRRFQQHLDDRLVFEQKRLLLTVVNTTALAIAILFSLPSLVVLSPIFPLVGACLILAITITTCSLTQALEAQRPKSSVEQLAPPEVIQVSRSSNGFFQPSRSLNSGEKNTEEEILDGDSLFSML